MKRNTLRKSRKSSKLAGNHPTKTWPLWLVPAIVAVATCVAFLPVLWNGFVEWDDYENLLNNPHYRGLGWNQLRWMFTTIHMGPYQPLSWLTLGVDYLLWGMNPVGYHLTSIILHAANAVFFYFICRRLLIAALLLAENEQSWRLTLSAAFAALFFAVHPLRVESVAWATERRDVVSGFFFLWTIYCYLRVLSPRDDLQSRRWTKTALAIYVLSLLSKAIAMTLPVVLLILDIYPLRRLEWDPRRWFDSTARGVLREKIPFLIVAVPFALIALFGQQQSSALRSLESYDAGSRLAQAFFGASFYLWKTLVPVKLSPLYEIPPHFSPLDSSILAGVAATTMITLSLYLLKNRWPAGLACWLSYIAILAPVLGLVQAGPQLVAERYSYLSCLTWAVLAGGAAFYLTDHSSRNPRWRAYGAAAAGTVILAVLGAVTWKQTQIWRDTGTLWRHVLTLDPRSSIAHYNLGRFLARQGNQADAIMHYVEAIKIRPDDADAHNNLGVLLMLRGEFEASMEEFQKATRINPEYSRAHFNMGKLFVRQGALDKAYESYRQALKFEPNEAEIHLGLGNVLARQGRLEAAMPYFQQAVKLKPGLADAYVELARSLAAQGDKATAEKYYEEALRLLKSPRQTSPTP